MNVATTRAIQQQHDEVLTHLDRLDRLFHGDGRGVDHARARVLVRQHLEALQAVLASHFAAEEEGGYMAEILAPRPELSARAATLEGQHAEILRTLARTLASLPDARLAVIEGKLSELVVMLRSHESAERRLVEDAVLQDFGAGD